MIANIHEHAAASGGFVASLAAVPFNANDLGHWLTHLGTSVLVGLLTWVATHVVKAGFVRLQNWRKK